MMPPDPNYIAVTRRELQAIDEWPQPWRLLVYEFGFKPVWVARAEFRRAEEARNFLVRQRKKAMDAKIEGSNV